MLKPQETAQHIDTIKKANWSLSSTSSKQQEFYSAPVSEALVEALEGQGFSRSESSVAFGDVDNQYSIHHSAASSGAGVIKNNSVIITKAAKATLDELCDCDIAKKPQSTLLEAEQVVRQQQTQAPEIQP